MRQTLTLTNPIKINGVETYHFEYDANEITAPLFAQAEAMKKQAAGMKNVAIVPAVEFDFSLHLYLGFAAIVAVNTDVDFHDCERMKGVDTVNVMSIGRNFILKSGASQESNSDEQYGTIVELSTPAQQN